MDEEAEKKTKKEEEAEKKTKKQEEAAERWVDDTTAEKAETQSNGWPSGG